MQRIKQCRPGAASLIGAAEGSAARFINFRPAFGARQVNRQASPLRSAGYGEQIRFLPQKLCFSGSLPISTPSLN